MEKGRTTKGTRNKAFIEGRGMERKKSRLKKRLVPAVFGVLMGGHAHGNDLFCIGCIRHYTAP